VAAALLGRAGELDLGPAEERLTPAGPGRCSLKTLTHHELVHGLEPVGTVVLSSLLAPHGLSVQMVMTSPTPGLQIEERWVHSLLYHVSMATTSRILRDRDAERQQQQERYLRGLLRAQEDERARIARDLHDTIAQDLAALRLEIERLSNRADAGALGPDLAGLEARTATILQTTRGILLDLRLTVLEGMGFLPSLQWHLERLEREHGIHGTLAVEGEPRRLPYHLSVPLFRIFQECVNNVVQHAEAEQVVATVVWGDDLLRLTVRDDGRGFDAGADTADGHASGLGLLGIGERTRLLGGSLAIASRRDEGPTVTVEVPLPAPPIEEDP
jgi:signal transduction histidine kinase